MKRSLLVSPLCLVSSRRRCQQIYEWAWERWKIVTASLALAAIQHHSATHAPVPKYRPALPWLLKLWPVLRRRLCADCLQGGLAPTVVKAALSRLSPRRPWADYLHGGLLSRLSSKRPGADCPLTAAFWTDCLRGGLLGRLSSRRPFEPTVFTAALRRLSSHGGFSEPTVFAAAFWWADCLRGGLLSRLSSCRPFEQSLGWLASHPKPTVHWSCFMFFSHS